MYECVLFRDVESADCPEVSFHHTDEFGLQVYVHGDGTGSRNLSTKKALELYRWLGRHLPQVGCSCPCAVATPTVRRLAALDEDLQESLVVFQRVLVKFAADPPYVWGICGDRTTGEVFIIVEEEGAVAIGEASTSLEAAEVIQERRRSLRGNGV